MEEASVAGESPDRSKQQESSGKRTPAPEERDPRLAVARDSAARVDQPTAVFSTAGAGGGATDDGAERNVPHIPRSPRAEANSGTESGGASRRDSGSGTESGGASRDGSTSSGESTAAERRPRPEDRDADQNAGTGPGEGAEGQEGTEGGDARLRAAVAAWVAKEDEPEGAGKPGEPRKPGERETGSGPDSAPAGDTGDTGGQDGTDNEDGSDRTHVSDRKKASGGAPSRGAGGGPSKGVGGAAKAIAATRAAKAKAKGPQAGADSTGEPEKDSKAVPKGSAAADGDAAEDGSGPPASKDSGNGPAKGSKGPVDEPAKQSGGTSTGGTSSGGTPTGGVPSGRTSTGKTSTGVQFGKRPGRSSDRAPAPVDQPTTAFKVSTAPLDRPDSVTTTLKSPGGPKSDLSDRPKGTGGDSGTKKGGTGAGTGTEAGAPKGGPSGRGAESESERTSKFVPLRPLDERSTPQRASDRTSPERGAPKWAAKEQPRTGEGTAAGTTGATAKGAAAESASPGTPSTSDPKAAATGGATSAVPGRTGQGWPGQDQALSEGTRQQPLPPKPPLDLLAELTNTPAPAETRLRTTVRRFKIWTPLVILLLIVFAVVQTFRPLPDPTLSLTADETFSFGGAKPDMPWPSSGQGAMDVDGLGTFGMSGTQKPVPIASVAKVMTAYVVLRDHPVKKGSDGAEITMDQKAEDDAGKSAQNESTVDVKKGQKLSQKETLQAIMIASANNIARQLARWDAGSESAFVDKMNATAKGLGMKNTHYTDPSGLTKTTVSTAQDQVKLAKKAMKDPLFREVVRMPAYKDINGKNQPNWNQLVPVNNTVGIKTGTTTAAGGNLLFAATKEVGGTTRTIIGAVLAQPPAASDNSILTGALTAGDKLIKAAQGELEAKKVVKKGDVVGTVDDGLGGTTPVVATKDVTAVGWSGLTVKLELADDGKTIPHTAGPGTKVGVLRVGDGTNGAVEVPVALQQSLEEPGFGAKLTRVG
ncbi:D-alanyl-D-alanine carboxypeptidase [Streptomyces tsukubensis]|uniref:serine hydrolase n=1 Tax=Streptomyces tsukubensis TaxID=83656 RepID=UPI001265E862|nr:serine hydrolase [Streptomyces tsukubensis]QFR94113.1 D-alanyl-D-alanine carboxypeptidase [Streptomyces tsukubensis]